MWSLVGVAWIGGGVGLMVGRAVLRDRAHAARVAACHALSETPRTEVSINV